MSDKPTVNVTNESGLIWLVLLVFVILCYGDPDVLDVLAEWCRRYMESAPK